MKTTDITDAPFREAVEAIDSGNTTALQQLLRIHPELPTRRLSMPADGYFAHPYLLWFVAGNPVRQPQLPPNITEMAAAIIRVIPRTHPGYQHQLDYTVMLVCTGRIARECNVQLPLLELLLKEGAAVPRSVLAAIGQHNMEAARYLLEKGAGYNLATAVGLEQMDKAKALVKNASAAERYVALVVASFFGRPGFISLLLDEGTDVNGYGQQEDFAGFHSHASPLHQAVQSGSLECVKLLTAAGARLHAVDTVYNGTPLDWAQHLQTEEKTAADRKKYAAIEKYLLAQQNR